MGNRAWSWLRKHLALVLGWCCFAATFVTKDPLASFLLSLVARALPHALIAGEPVGYCQAQNWRSTRVPGVDGEWSAVG